MCQRDVHNEVESFLSFVEHVGHGHGEDVVHGFDGCDHAFGSGDHIEEFHFIFHCFLCDLVWADLPNFGNGDSSGERADFVLPE